LAAPAVFFLAAGFFAAAGAGFGSAFVASAFVVAGLGAFAAAGFAAAADGLAAALRIFVGAGLVGAAVADAASATIELSVIAGKIGAAGIASGALTPGMTVAPFFNGSSACGVEAAGVAVSAAGFGFITASTPERTSAAACSNGLSCLRISAARIEASQQIDRLLDVIEFGFLQRIVELFRSRPPWCAASPSSGRRCATC
jgi:hypothetical protein